MELLELIAAVSVACVTFAQGLTVSPAQLMGVFRSRPWLVARVLLAVLVLVPAAALFVMLLLHPDPTLRIGLAIIVACPPAPLMVSSAPRKGASAVLMAPLYLGLSAFAIVTVPAVLFVLSELLGFNPQVHIGAMVWMLARTNILPIGLGIAIRGVAPALAARLGPAFGRIGMAVVGLVVVLVLVRFYPALRDMDAWSYLVVGLISAAALAIGHFAGPADPRERASLAIVCGVRHPALTLAIAGATMSEATAVPVLVPSILSFIVMGTIYLTLSARIFQARA